MDVLLFSRIKSSFFPKLYYLQDIKLENAMGEKLRLVPKFHDNILTMSIDTRGDVILLGDLIQSMAIVKFDGTTTTSTSSTVGKTATDFNTAWMTAVKILREDCYLGADMCYNLFTLKRSMDSSKKLEPAGEYHLGDMVNAFQEGSLAQELHEHELDKPPAPGSSFIYATVNGAVGVIASLTREQYELLLVVQEKILNVLPKIGDFDHAEYRTLENGVRQSPARNFIDGDLIERFLTLSPKDKEKVVHGLGCSVEQLQQFVEEMSRKR